MDVNCDRSSVDLEREDLTLDLWIDIIQETASRRP